MKDSSQIFPFFFSGKSNLLDLNGIDLPSQLKLSESYDFESKPTILFHFNLFKHLVNHKVKCLKISKTMLIFSDDKIRSVWVATVLLLVLVGTNI